MISRRNLGSTNCAFRVSSLCRTPLTPASLTNARMRLRVTFGGFEDLGDRQCSRIYEGHRYIIGAIDLQRHHAWQPHIEPTRRTDPLRANQSRLRNREGERALSYVKPASP